MRVLALVLALLLSSAPTASGQDAPGEPVDAPAPGVPNSAAAQPQPAGEHLHQTVEPASTFKDAPRADAARNLERPASRGARALLWLPRVVFFIPRWTLEVAFALPRLSLWAYDRYQLAERFKLVFFNDKQDFGVYPVALFETGFGLNVGARIVHRDLFGSGEHLTLRASYGGQFRQLYRMSFETGDLITDGVSVTLEADYELHPDSHFYGIGNGDEVAASTVSTLIDPAFDATAVETHFQQDVARVAGGLQTRLRQNLQLGGTVAFRHTLFDAGSTSAIELPMIYDQGSVVGYLEGRSNIYSELELAYDSRRNTRPMVWGQGTGLRAHAFAGYALGLGDDPSNFLRYGLDMSALLNLYRGNRILALRLYLEGVTTDLAQVPFVDLPRLGGPLLLRGYARDRFRDRVAAAGTAEYQYPLSRNLWAYLFIDAGRVYSGLDDLALKGLRIGYGGGLQVHSQDAFQTRFHIASSIDGGLFFSLSFDPSFEALDRGAAK